MLTLLRLGKIFIETYAHALEKDQKSLFTVSSPFMLLYLVFGDDIENEIFAKKIKAFESRQGMYFRIVAYNDNSFEVLSKNAI